GPAEAWLHPRGRTLIPAGLALRGLGSCQPAFFSQDFLQTVLGDSAVGNRLLERGNSLRQRLNLATDGGQHVARDVEGPVLFHDLVASDDLGSAFYVNELSNPADDSPRMRRIEEVLSAALPNEGRSIG